MRKKSGVFKLIIFGMIGFIVLMIVLKQTGVFKGNMLKVETEEIERKDLTEIVTASGKVQPEQEVKISPDVSGEVIELNVILGQKVKTGDLLLKIQPDIYKAAVNQAQASLNNLKAQLRASEASYKQFKSRTNNTRKNFERNKKLFNSKIISQADFDAFELEYLLSEQQAAGAYEQLQSTKYSVQSAQSSLKEANDRLSRTLIYAPIDGTVTSLSVEKGERVVGTNQMAGTEIMRIADLRLMEVLIEVSEIDIPRLSESDSAIIEIDAYPNKKFKGMITEIARSAKNNNTQSFSEQSSTFEVKSRILPESYADLVEPSSDEAPFMPGMSAMVDIITERKKNVIAVPILAVTTEDPEADSMSSKATENLDQLEIIFIHEDGVAKKRVVKTGIQDDFYIEILEGVSDKEEIIKGPYDAVTILLKDGKKVERKEKSEKGRP